MSTKIVYRIASILLVFFAIGHQIGFRQVDPSWRVDSVVEGMKSVHFPVGGMVRSYWEFFSGFGFFVTVLLLFAAVLAWQLGGLSKDTLRKLALTTWTFAIAFAVITFFSWRYFFIAPLVSSALVTLCLLVAAHAARSDARIS